MTATPFAEKFRELASSSEKNYRELAKAMDLSAPLLARVLNGSRPPTPKFVDRCVQVFALDADSAKQLQYLAEISQSKISIVPRNVEEAQKIVAFIRELRGEHVDGKSA